MKRNQDFEIGPAAGVARVVLKDMLRRRPVSLDEIGRRLGHARGYMSRALRGANALTLDTIVGALEVAEIAPADYFAAVADALTPDDALPSQEQIERTVLRTLRRLGWMEGPGNRGSSGGAPTR
jgi:hypothetical protein